MTPELLDRYLVGTSEVPALRTLRASEVLDETLRAYRALAPALLRRSAVPAVFVVACVLFWSRACYPLLFSTKHPGDVVAQVAEAWVVVGLGILVGGPLLMLGVTEATLQAVALVGPVREGRRADEAGAAERGRAGLGRALAAGVWTLFVGAAAPVASFAIIAGAGLLTGTTDESSPIAGILAVVGVFGLTGGIGVALWVVASHALAPAAVLRGESGRSSCRTSRRLLSAKPPSPGGYGTVWAVYGTIVLAALAEYLGLLAAQAILGFGAALAGADLVSQVLSLLLPFVVSWTLLPFWGVAVAVIDAERRVRVEGHDVEILARG